MINYIIRRFIQAIYVIVAISILSFALLTLGGDPTLLMVGEGWTSSQVEEYRHTMGFDKPWYTQYLQFAGNAIRGDFGKSLRSHQPVWRLIRQRMPATLKLAVFALVIGCLMAIPIGIIAGINRGKYIDHISVGIAMIGQAVPVFVIGMSMLLLFGVKLKLFPISGAGSWRHLVLPVVAISIQFTARISRMMRSSVLEVLSKDYIRTARAKGLSEKIVICKHIFRNSLISVITLTGIELGYLLGGAIVTEQIFAYPGMGLLIIDAIYYKDFPVVQGVVIFLAVSFTLINLLVDITYAFLDPRVRIE